MKTLKLSCFAFTFLCFFSCDILTTLPENRTAYYWIIADADTYVECVKAGGACVPVEANYSGRSLVTAHGAHGVKRSYIDFPLPDFPQGTVVEEAYVELFHSGTNEDGKRDDIFIDVSRVREPWVADNVHYSNQPVQTGITGEFQIRLESNAWSGSSDIGFLMNQEIKNASNFHGFVAFIGRPEPAYEKGYYSNNDQSVIRDGMGKAPRLLLKVELPEGVNVNEIGFSERHSDTNGGRIFGSRVRQTEDWPSEWEVAVN
jgi:hypothetical protein